MAEIYVVLRDDVCDNICVTNCEMAFLSLEEANDFCLTLAHDDWNWSLLDFPYDQWIYSAGGGYADLDCGYISLIHNEEWLNNVTFYVQRTHLV